MEKFNWLSWLVESYSVLTGFGVLPNVPEIVHALENTPDAKRTPWYFFPRTIIKQLPIEKDNVT